MIVKLNLEFPFSNSATTVHLLFSPFLVFFLAGKSLIINPQKTYFRHKSKFNQRIVISEEFQVIIKVSSCVGIGNPVYIVF